MTHCFLYLTNNISAPWSTALRRSLSIFGELTITPEEQWADETQLCQYSVIFIDAATVADVPALIITLRRQCPTLRIVVATSSPTWKQAREAMQAGAVDYIRKTPDLVELHTQIDFVLKNPPSSLPAV